VARTTKPLRSFALFYLPPNEFWYLTVARLSVSFDDNKTGSGTGFFVIDDDQYFLVTARHVVDPKYLPGTKKRHAVCTDMQIAFQCAVDPGTSGVRLSYQIFGVSEPTFCFESEGLDVAVFKFPRNVLPIRQGGQIVRPCSFQLNYLASQGDLSQRYAGEPVVFVGFPDNSPVQRVGETEFHYPLLRQGVFAYPPIHGIDVDGELGHDYGLIDSFAQSGFSGGPIVSLQKGWSDGSWHPKEDYRPPRVVGLVCGHYRSAQDRSDGVHAGLSFFARSTSISEAIAQAKALTD
jgi:hypothetical protein